MALAAFTMHTKPNLNFITKCHNNRKMFRCMKIFENCYKYKRKLCKSLNKSFCDNHSKEKLKILFFGTDNFSLPSLNLLHEESKKDSTISNISVVTSFKSHLNPVRSFATAKSLEIYKWPIEKSVPLNYDIGIVVSFGHYIPSPIISAFKLGMINVHASLLPRWRGAAPLIYALMNGDKTTGVSIMKIMPKHFDTGDILAQREVPIHADMKLPELHDLLADEGAKLLVENVKNINKYLKEAKKQDEALVTYAPKIVSPFEEVIWSEMTAEQVYKKYRSLYSFKNLTAKWIGQQKVKIMEMKFNREQNENSSNKRPGFFEYDKRRRCLRIYCKGGHFVEVTKIGVEGKRVMDAIDFNNGFVKKCNVNDRYFE